MAEAEDLESKPVPAAIAFALDIPMLLQGAQDIARRTLGYLQTTTDLGVCQTAPSLGDGFEDRQRTTDGCRGSVVSKVHHRPPSGELKSLDILARSFPAVKAMRQIL